VALLLRRQRSPPAVRSSPDGAPPLVTGLSSTTHTEVREAGCWLHRCWCLQFVSDVHASVCGILYVLAANTFVAWLPWGPFVHSSLIWSGGDVWPVLIGRFLTSSSNHGGVHAVGAGLWAGDDTLSPRCRQGTLVIASISSRQHIPVIKSLFCLFDFDCYTYVHKFLCIAKL
jgi:hypothetical protein